MIIADENGAQELIKGLENAGHKVYSIQKHHQGVSDRMVFEIVKSKKVFR